MTLDELLDAVDGLDMQGVNAVQKAVMNRRYTLCENVKCFQPGDRVAIGADKEGVVSTQIGREVRVTLDSGTLWIGHAAYVRDSTSPAPEKRAVAPSPVNKHGVH
jgi:hypothetical protein